MDDAMSTVHACARIRAPTHLFTRRSSMAVIDNEIREIAAFKAPTVRPHSFAYLPIDAVVVRCMACVRCICCRAVSGVCTLYLL